MKPDCNHLIEHTVRNIEHCAPTLASGLLIRKIDRYIKELKENEERRQEYILLNLVEMDARKDGIQQGKSIGFGEGKIETAPVIGFFDAHAVHASHTTGQPFPLISPKNLAWQL